MRRIIASERVTLDGFIARPNGEMDWMEAFFDEALADYESELQQRIDTVMFGRVTYQGFEGYWPMVAEDPASPKDQAEYARRFNALRKVVFSRTLAHAGWNNSALIREIEPEAIMRMKQEPGRDIVIFGSASVVQTLTNLGLIDIYQLLVYPIVLGSGKPLFHHIVHTVNLKLTDTNRHPSGVVALSYQRV
ncbi:MAG TPA: dihydrofolate reductase family protein [Ktedonobacterales bacterium]|nr:dihydrofolate reductase family protein [Ktedonobacterales bacterium]